MWPPSVTADVFMVSAVIVLSCIYAFVNLHWTKYSTFVYYDFTTNGEGEWRGKGPLKAGTGRRKPQQVRARQAQAFGSGKHATAGNGVMVKV